LTDVDLVGEEGSEIEEDINARGLVILIGPPVTVTRSRWAGIQRA
jgi:hypothetical protein